MLFEFLDSDSDTDSNSSSNSNSNSGLSLSACSNSQFALVDTDAHSSRLNVSNSLPPYDEFDWKSTLAMSAEQQQHQSEYENENELPDDGELDFDVALLILLGSSHRVLSLLQVPADLNEVETHIAVIEIGALHRPVVICPTATPPSRCHEIKIGECICISPRARADFNLADIT
ncbi:hypothetical protein HK100_011567 [Physocladia obscura]|uniref:Uncharacterized protein n=1 Tax=Physocladia obscura TaxID=109957 RepID=A0AAD5TEI6_9FUNG|nr:hypothetical protein HK100_011567 [Physocladia obscura]